MTKKIAVIGTSGSGKTTLVLELTAALKKAGVKAEPLIGSDREFKFRRWQIEQDMNAQYYVIFYHLTKELELTLREEVDVVVSDRSVLDFYAYLETTFQRDEAIWELVKFWLSTYDALYYLPPKYYQRDGKRPSKRFALEVNKVLNGLIEELKKDYPIHRLRREEIFFHAQALLGVTGKHRILTKQEIARCLLALNLKEDEVLIGGSYGRGCPSSTSDLDLYVKGMQAAIRTDLEELGKRILGVPVQVTELPKKAFEDMKEVFPLAETFLKGGVCHEE